MSALLARRTPPALARMPRTRTLAATVALASAHMPGEYHPPGEHGQLERFIEWLPWSSLGRMPPTDGARWYADPQTVSNLFLAIIAVLMIFQHVDFFLHFRERRFGPLVRESPLHLRRRSRALVRGLRRRLPRRQPRQPIVFSRARATLEAKLSTMVGLDEVKAHLSNMLDTLEMDARRCAQMPSFVTQARTLTLTLALALTLTLIPTLALTLSLTLTLTLTLTLALTLTLTHRGCMHMVFLYAYPYPHFQP